MKALVSICCLALLICFSAAFAHGDYLEVRRSATIRAEHDVNSAILDHVQPGTYLELLDEGEQTEGYYHVPSVSLGQPGWIYRTLVRRHPGEIPLPDPEAALADPLGDPTIHLTAEQRGYAARHLRLGKPQAVYERVREGYVLAHDARLKIPLWVQYQLSPEDVPGTAERSDDFRPDTSIPFGFRAELNDYSGSGYDRGHMAPAADMQRSDHVMSESFLLSNMAPQVGIGFNRHIWANLEAAVRGWVEQRGTLTVITGPVFAVATNRVAFDVVGNSHVAVPTHFYKIVVDANDPNNPAALAFLLPNQSLSGQHYNQYLRSIDEIEAATGLDFLSALPAAVQQNLESQPAPAVW
jgi:endonuclease G